MTRRSFLFCVSLVTAVSAGCREGSFGSRPPSLRQQFIELAEARAKAKDASAHLYLGWTYATGSGVVKDKDHALNHLEAAAKFEDPLAAGLLEILKSESAEQMDELVGEIRSGAAAGDKNAQMIMATWLVFGEGVSKDPR